MAVYVPPDAAKVAYLAGFFDGEGNVTIQVKPRGMSTFLRLYNCERSPLELAHSLYGGSIKERPGVNRPGLYWQVCGPDSERFARDILPFSLVKATALEAYIAVRESMPRRRR